MDILDNIVHWNRWTANVRDQQCAHETLTSHETVASHETLTSHEGVTSQVENTNWLVQS